MNYYSLLTDRAQQALDSASDEYRKVILNEAYNLSKQNGTEGEIAHKDILEAIQKVFKQSVYSNKISEVRFQNMGHTETNNIQRGTISNLKFERRKTIILFLFILSLAYISFGALFYFVEEFHLFSHSHSMFPFVAFGVVGLIISLFLYLFLLLFKRMAIIKGEIQKSKEQDYVIENLWKEIEYYGFMLLKDKKQSDTELNVSSVIEHLSEILKLEGEDLNLRKVLQARNYLVHNGSYDVSADDKEKIISMAKEILLLLEKKINKLKDI